MALDAIISEEYKAKFIDDRSYSSTAHDMLQGLAAVMEDETDEWRPTMTELIQFIPHDQYGERLVKAGHAYGAGKQLRSSFPALAILLFCSALNRIGNAPNTELRESITRAKKIIKEAGLDEDESLKSVIQAAYEWTDFDKVTQMLRNEFRDGLQSTGRYSDEALNQIVRDIVRVGNEARHEALIDIMDWSPTPVSDLMIMNFSSIEGQNFWELLLMRRKEGYTFFGTGHLDTLAAQAEKGCAQALLARLEPLRETDG
jgi:hypothetical protein